MSRAGSPGRRPRYLFPAVVGVLVPAALWGVRSWEDLWSGGRTKAGREAAAVVVIDESAAATRRTDPTHRPDGLRRPPVRALAAGLTAMVPSVGTSATATPVPAEPAPDRDANDPTREAKQIMARCRQAYLGVNDYSCTFTKRERLDDGSIVGPHAMHMKVSARPLSVYFRFLQPFAGREAIWVAGGNEGKVLVHEGGVARLLAGTLKLDPTSGLALKGCRHPISEAGLGYLIEQVASHWEIELKPGESVVTIHHDARVGNRPCTMIEAKHPEHRQGYVHHKVKVYVDHELNLPIRFEAYAWPQEPVGPSDLIEEYTYLNLKINPGLSPSDFDPANSAYGFSRF